jgi:hypothetical protein
MLPQKNGEPIGESMNYVNEYASADDVAAFNLDAIWNKYHPFDKRPQPNTLYEWTIDRGARSFLARVITGRDDLAGTVTFVFHFEGVVYEMVLRYDGPGRMDASPFRIRWRVLRLDPEPTDSKLREHLISALKEALGIYGYWGIREQLPNTQVTLQL